MFCLHSKKQYQGKHNTVLCQQHLNYYRQIFDNGAKNGWHTVTDFTMTACNRVELIEPTCYTLKQQLEDIDLKKSTIYCNVDPLLIPDTEDKVKTCLEKYFGKVVINKPNSPNFAKAVKWCWTQSDKSFIFHLEDDWHFIEKFKIVNLFKMLIPYNFVSSVQLYKGEQDKGLLGLIRLSPSLHKTIFIKQIANLMTTTDNPEGQLRHKKQFFVPGGVAAYMGLCYKPGHRLIQNIGIDWRKNKNIKHTVFFNKWELMR